MIQIKKESTNWSNHKPLSIMGWIFLFSLMKLAEICDFILNGFLSEVFFLENKLESLTLYLYFFER